MLLPCLFLALHAIPSRSWLPPLPFHAPATIAAPLRSLIARTAAADGRGFVELGSGLEEGTKGGRRTALWMSGGSVNEGSEEKGKGDEDFELEVSYSGR